MPLSATRRGAFFLALLATPLVMPTDARAYSSPARFEAPIEDAAAESYGGGAGRWFTGSPADGFTCAVCHGADAAPAPITLEGVPEVYRPGERYELTLRWPEDAAVGAALEITDELGAPVGTLEVLATEAEERCGELPATTLQGAPDRSVAVVEPCGARRSRLAWTAPESATARLALAAVAANRSGDPRGDGVALGRRALVREGAPAAEAAVAEGCAVSAAGDVDPDADPKGAGALALLLLALLALRRRPTIAALLALVGVALFSPRVARADEVAAGLYIRADTDDITVVSPKLRANVRLGDRTTVGAGYAADIWTGASIDVRTAATRPIREQRDELTAHLAHELDDVTLGASYRFSHEGDYDSHGGALDATWRFAEGNATVRARLLAAQDVVGRAGDPDFARRLGTLGAHLVYTQNVDRLTLLQLAYELTRREGYQASPYRFVGIGGDGSCAGTAQLCVAEAHPGLRMRNAAVARFRRAFGERFSFGAAYRFYGDDWGLFGHTITAQLGVLPGERDLVTLRARFHGQDAASFYRARYEERPGERLRYVTRDRELGALFTTRVQLAWERTLDLTDAGPELQLTLAAAGTHLRYRDFVGLDQVWAVELTFAAVVLL